MKIFIGGLRDDANRYDIEDCFAKASQFERDFLIFVSHGSILSSLRNRIRSILQGKPHYPDSNFAKYDSRI